jgi:hypothetical protein
MVPSTIALANSVGEIIRLPGSNILPATPAAIKKVNELAHAIRTQLPALPFVTEHVLHGGMYTRTVRLPPRTIIAAALIKRTTMLIIDGDCDVWVNDKLIRVAGYSVITGTAGRKFALTTYSAVNASMVFPTDAKTIDEAQREFTDEHEMLPSLANAGEHAVLITGE